LLFIMADDLNADWKNDRMDYMPNLKRRFKDAGTTFENHVAAVPVCGPSRSSLLLGRYPHGDGYKMNGDLKSIADYAKVQNLTLGKWLADAGYHTSFLGKYVNNFENQVAHGWSHWGSFVNTYDFYNASHHDMDWPTAASPDPPVVVKTMTGIHQADFLQTLTLREADKAVAKGKPFFISVTPVMPHWGTCYGPGPAAHYSPDDPHWEMLLVDPDTGKVHPMPTSPCPTVKNAQKFAGRTNPHVPGVWNVSILGPRPKFMAEAFEKPGLLTAWQEGREDIGWRNRSAALMDLDDMVGGIMDGLEERGLLNETIVFFTR
jgi:arylsulfatase A-like enzyme